MGTVNYDGSMSVNQAILNLLPGDVLMLPAGEFVDEFAFTVNGNPDAPIGIVGDVDLNGVPRTHLFPKRGEKNTVKIFGYENLFLERLHLIAPQMQDDGQAVHISFNTNTRKPPRNITVRRCWIEQRGGDGVKASKAYVVHVIENLFTGVKGREESVDYVGVGVGSILRNLFLSIGRGGCINTKGGSYDIDVEGNIGIGGESHVYGIGGRTGESSFDFPEMPEIVQALREKYECRNVRFRRNKSWGGDDVPFRCVGARDCLVEDNEACGVKAPYAFRHGPTTGKLHTPEWDSRGNVLRGNRHDAPEAIAIDNPDVTIESWGEGVPEFPDVRTLGFPVAIPDDWEDPVPSQPQNPEPEPRPEPQPEPEPDPEPVPEPEPEPAPKPEKPDTPKEPKPEEPKGDAPVPEVTGSFRLVPQTPGVKKVGADTDEHGAYVEVKLNKAASLLLTDGKAKKAGLRLYWPD